MKFSPNNLCSISEANENFSRIARLVDENGSVVILKNNTPHYIILPFQKNDKVELMPDEELLAVSDDLMQENQKVYAALARWLDKHSEPTTQG